MTAFKSNPPEPLEFQIVLRARTRGTADTPAGKWVNVVMTQPYDSFTMADYDGMAIDVDVETITDRVKRSLRGDYP